MKQLRSYILITLATMLVSCAETPEAGTSTDPIVEGPTSTMEQASATKEESTTDEAQTEPTRTEVLKPAGTAFTGPAKLVFAKTAHDFGTHSVGDSVEVYYEFQNQGGDDLVFSNAKPSCSCTGVQFTDGKTFKSGQKGRIRVSYPTQGKVGFNAKNVLVFSNASAKPEKLTFQLEVEP